jgi:undecaprenyl diphosphate synthase
MIINVCVNYSGRVDLVKACQQLAAEVAEGQLSATDINDAAIAGKLCMSDLGNLQDPDLVIRTSGEQRISNFLLWQVAYSEFVFLEALWPDFGKEELRDALVNYQKRDRRYGMRVAQRHT